MEMHDTLKKFQVHQRKVTNGSEKKKRMVMDKKAPTSSINEN
jgi:hypothetical protein